jgi:hypothetical protein
VIPKTGPVSLGDLKNETAAATASFSDPRIQRRLIKDKQFVDLLGYNPPMSLGDFRGSVVTCHKDFNAEGVAPKREEWGCYGYDPQPGGFISGSVSREPFSGPRDTVRAEVRATLMWPFDVALIASMNAYCPTATNVEWNFYFYSNGVTRRIISVDAWSSGWRRGTNINLFNSEALKDGNNTVNFTTQVSHPWICLTVAPVKRRDSSADASIYLHNSAQGGSAVNWNICEAREK